MPYAEPTAPDGVDAAAWSAAVAEVRGYCGWHIAPEVTETLTVNGPGGDELGLPTLHLVELVSITSDGAVVADPEWSTSGMVRRGGCWSRKLRGVVAEVTHGLEEWPADVLAVVAEMAADGARGGVSQVASGSHSVTYDRTPSERQRATLDRYRLPGFA